MLDLTPFQQQTIMEEKPNIYKPVCVIIHLYYQDLWEWFEPYLNNITYDFDLYVSTNFDSAQTDLQSRVKAFYPNAYYYEFENKGLDVAPFIFIVNDILSQGKTYDCIIKLHGKKSIAHGIDLGNSWRLALTNSIMGTIQNFEYCFNAVVKNPNYKLAGSQVWTLPQNVIGYEKEFFNNQELPFSQYEFVGGTMFMINYSLIKDWFEKGNVYEKFYNNFPLGYIGDGSLAHQFERVFGCLIKLYGFQIYKC